jgi:hypothetical protein
MVLGKREVIRHEMQVVEPGQLCQGKSLQSSVDEQEVLPLVGLSVLITRRVVEPLLVFC